MKMSKIIDKNTSIYFSVPPEIYPNLLKCVINFEYKSIALEKPYSVDFEAFKAFNLKSEDKNLKLIDHFLNKEMSLAIEIIKNKNKKLFDFLLNENERNVINSIEGYFNETIGANGRLYFDKTGIIKDVVQNHLLEMLCVILVGGADGKFSEERAKLIKSLKIDDENVYFGQYEGYNTEMQNVKTRTLTAVGLVMNSNADKLKNVPIFFFAGKGLCEKKSSIEFNLLNEYQNTKKNYNNEKRFIVNKNGENILRNPIIDSLDFIKNKEMKEDFINSGIKAEKAKIIFKFSPKPEIVLKFKSSSFNKEFIILSTEEIKKLAEIHYKGLRDYSLVLYSLIKGREFPCAYYNEIYEAWRIFTPILLKSNNLNNESNLLNFYKKESPDVLIEDQKDELPIEAMNFRKKYLDY